MKQSVANAIVHSL